MPGPDGKPRPLHVMMAIVLIILWQPLGSKHGKAPAPLPASEAEEWLQQHQVPSLVAPAKRTW